MVKAGMEKNYPIDLFKLHDLFGSLELKKVNFKKGEKRMEDCEVDGVWMRGFMERLADKICQLTKGRIGGLVEDRGRLRDFAVSMGAQAGRRRIVLQIDGAGGHGTKKDIEFYTDYLKKRGIDLEFQPSNSPDTNVLDLGVWRWIQQVVDRLQKGQRNNAKALDDTVRGAWDALGDDREMHNNIWDKLVRNAKMCIAQNGDNTFAEARGEKQKELIDEYDKL